MKFLSCLLLGALLASSCQSQTSKTDAPLADGVTIFTGASLFDGDNFVARSLCTKGARIVACPETASERTVDLSGLFVTPPFGDAHTHHFDGPYTLDWHTGMGLDSGAFYAMTMTAPTSGVTEIRDRLSGPGRVDVATSLGGITGPDSHPAEIYEALALGIRDYEEQVARADEIQASRKVADNAYYVVTDANSVREKMAVLLENDPDHVKVFLRKSDRHADHFGKWGPGGGIAPELLPLIADLARDADKRVAVAASNLADFRAALSARADILTHLPCYQDSAADPDSPYYDVDLAEDCLISAHDARQAAEVGMISTIILTEWAKDRPDDIVTWERANLAELIRAGAPLAVATNAYGSTLTDGLVAAFDKAVLPPAALLRVATMDTPRTIFPDRSVGCLEVGCEASFIAFADDPLVNAETLRTLAYRFKDGEPIDRPSE